MEVDVEGIFKHYCGPDVRYVSHTKEMRDLRICYKIPKVDEDRIFFIKGTMSNGLLLTARRMVLRAAESARQHAYIATGQQVLDVKKLLQGELVDEHPRSDAKAAEVGTAAVVDPES